VSREPAPQRAVVDRIVDGQAVLLVGDDEVEHHLPADELPEEAGEGAVLSVTVTGTTVQVVGHDQDEEEQQRQAMRGRLDRLRARSRRFGDDR
jgi:hypothetical protein